MDGINPREILEQLRRKLWLTGAGILRGLWHYVGPWSLLPVSMTTRRPQCDTFSC